MFNLQFSDKLDFLMNITKTTNSALAFNTNLDASYISRLRSGRRNVPRNQTYLRTMSEYFAKRCVEDYQRKALIDMMNISFLPSDYYGISEFVFNWIVSDQSKETKAVENFLIDFSNTKVKKPIISNKILENTLAEIPKTDKSTFYGIEGKRQAVICFLSEVLECKTPQTLLLFSDEPTDWMTDDKDFEKKWAFLMSQLLLKGNRIKIIHTVSRDLDEMLNAIGHWMPLYMSGLIEPYFYPKKRDGIFKKTLFIVPGVCAVISSSIGDMIDKACNLFFREQRAIAAFAEEFNQYLGICKPLMRVFTLKDVKPYLNTLLEFEKEKSDSMIKTESLSLLTMPENVVARITSRIGETSTRYVEYQKNRIKLFENNLKTNTFTEIIRLPDIESVINSKVKVALFVILGGGMVYYLIDEYIDHLENIIRLLNTYSNFHVHLTTENTDDRYMVYVREELGAIVAKTSASPVALAINENNMTAAFWDFFKDIIGEKEYQNMNNKKTIEKLIEYIIQLKQIRNNAN